MFRTESFYSDSDKYQITGIDYDMNGKIDDCFIEVNHHGEIEVWDNEDWMINELYPFLVAWKTAKTPIITSSDIEDIPEDDYGILLELLNIGMQRGFFVKYKKD